MLRVLPDGHIEEPTTDLICTGRLCAMTSLTSKKTCSRTCSRQKWLPKLPPPTMMNPWKETQQMPG